jgi:hypothetical protein
MKRLYRATAWLILLALFLAPVVHSQSTSRGITTWHADENFAIDVQNEFNTILGLINGPHPVGIPYDFIGVPVGSVLLRFDAPAALTFPANLASGTAAPASVCNAKVASTGTAVFKIEVNGVQMASATFTASTACTFSTQASFTMNAGDVLEVVSPSSPDATLANVAITIGAYR